MKVIVTGRNIQITDAIKGQVEHKLDKFDKFFRSDIEVRATFGVQKGHHTVELTIPFKNDSYFRAEATSDDMYKSIDLAVDKIAGQMKKHKTKISKRYQGHESIKFEEIPGDVEESQAKIVKTKRFGVKPMSPEEAVLQMEMLGHDFYVFLNGDSDEVNVVYMRKDGDYGLIEPEF